MDRFNGMSMSVYKHPNSSCGVIHFPKEISEYFITNEVVVKEVDGLLTIREATISDTKTNTITKKGNNFEKTLTYYFYDNIVRDSHLGKWKILIEDETIILEEKI